MAARDLPGSDDTKSGPPPATARPVPSGTTPPAKTGLGWTINEPGFLAIGLILVGTGTFLGWWGVETDVSQIPYRTSHGVEFGPVFATDWIYTILPGTIRREATTMAWWDFTAANPEFAGYLTIGIILTALYLGALALMVYAFIRRSGRGPRRNGWPTWAQAAAFVAVAAAIVIASLTLPGVADVSSFLGSLDRTQWGPRFGWLLAVAAPVFLGLSTYYGWRTDRNLKGKCWKCYRPVTSDPCEHCGTPQ